MMSPRTIPQRKARALGAGACALACLVLASCEKPKATAHPAAPDPVVARVDGAPVYRSDILREASSHGLAADAAAPGAAGYAGLVDQAVDQKLLAAQAVKEGLDRTTPGRRRLEAARDRVLSDMVLEDRLRGAVTQETVVGLYQEMEKAKPAGAAPETLEQARPRIVRFLTYDRVKDLVLDLRHRAKIDIVSPSPATGGAKP